MERMPENSDEKTGEEALKVMRGVLDGTIPGKDVIKTGINNATGETVKKVLKENTIVTPAMERDAKIADLKHNLKKD